MALSYANVRDIVEQMLQDTAGATYTTAETDYWIEEGLKELANYDPHIVPVIFKIESRTGTDTAGTASSLTDTTKSQFLAADATNEKVIHNTTDYTWAVVLTRASSSVLTLSANIMAISEDYAIYNKRCWNNRQIYIGDVTDYLWVDSVEYPIGTKRNFKIYGEVLEIDVAFVADSDSTQTSLPNVDVLVRFAKPHRLCQLTDLAGTCTAIEPADETALAVQGLLGAEIIEIGDELYIANHRNVYTVTTGVTLAGAGAGNGTGDIIVFPGMEAATAANDIITFTKSTLQPQYEELFCHLVAARAVLSDNISKINAVSAGGPNIWRDYQTWAERKLAEVYGKLRLIATPKSTRRYPRN